MKLDDNIDIILATFPLGDTDCLELAGTANELAKQAIEASTHLPPACLVGTKSDLVQSDYSKGAILGNRTKGSFLVDRQNFYFGMDVQM